MLEHGPIGEKYTVLGTISLSLYTLVVQVRATSYGSQTMSYQRYSRGRQLYAVSPRTLIVQVGVFNRYSGLPVSLRTAKVG